VQDIFILHKRKSLENKTDLYIPHCLN